MQNKPKIFKAILTSVLGFFAFTLSYLLAYLIFGGIIYVLLKIPLIGRLIDLIFFFRGDSPDLMLSLLCPGVAYFVTMSLQEKINKEAPTRGVSSVLLGIFIMLLNIASLIINLIYGDGILKNVIQIIAGLVIFFGGMGEIKEN